MPAARWWLLGGWLGALALLVGWAALSLRPGMDLSQFLPRGASQQDQVLLSQVRSGVAARTLLLRIGGAETRPSAEALADTSRALAAVLRAAPGIIEVFNGALSPAVAGADALLFRHRYLIGPPAACASALDESALRSALTQRLDELASGFALLDKQRLAADPTACYRALLRALLPRSTAHRRNGVWLSPDDSHALLVVVTGARASDLEAQRRIVERIERAFADLPETVDLDLDLELAGPAYFAVGSEQRIKTETTLLSTVASVAVALVLAMAFRSAALVLLGLLPVLSGVLAGALSVSLLFGSVHGITLALGVTLLGVALDYPVHVYTHAAGVSPEHRRPVWRTLLLGMLTTVLGYGALALSGFEGLSQLGVLAAVGLATAALTSRYLLPPLLPPGYRLPPYRWLGALEPRIPRLSLRAGLLVLLLALVVLALALAVQGSPWQTDIRRLSTVPQHEIDKDSLIRDQLGAPDVARLLYLVANDQEAVLQRLEAARPDLERLVERGLIDGFDDVSLWLPSAATQRERQRSLPDRQTLANALSAANAQLPFRLARLEAFLDDVEASRGLAPLRAGDLAGSPVGVRVSMLLQPLDGRWLGLVPLSGVNGDAAVASLEDLADRHDLAYLDLREGTAELLSGFFTDALDRMLVVAALIVLTLALALRDPVRVSRILMPIAIALTVTFLLVLRLHGAASLFHLISLLLVVGLAIDYGLFLSRPVSDAADRRRTLLSVSVGAVSSCAMFAMLALSDIPALRAIGSTVAVGTLCAFSASLLLARPREE